MKETFDQFIVTKQKAVKEEQEKLKENGGVLFETEKGSKDEADKHFVNFFGTRVETKIETLEEFEHIKQTVDFSELDEVLFSRIAQAYSLEHSLMLEGDPGSGKTFCYSKFNEFLEGEGKQPLILTCTPKMSELEIVGHWMPSPGGRSSHDPNVQIAYGKFDKTKEEYDGAIDEYQARLTEAKEALEKKDINEQEYRSRLSQADALFEPIQAKFRGETEALRAETEGQVEWAFKKGALLEAYTGNKGKGRMLVVDEFNLLPSSVQQIFLETVSNGAKLKDHLVNNSNSSQTVYEKGEMTYICYAQNFPEKTRGRNVVAAPMTDRVEWLAIPQDLVDKKEVDFIKTWRGSLKRTEDLNASEKIRTYDKQNLPIAEMLNGQVAQVWGQTLGRFHQEYKAMTAQTPDAINKEERIQELETSVRRSVQAMNHMERFLLRDKDGRIDLEKTFIEAVTKNYADRIFDKTLRDKVITKLNEFISDPTLGVIMFEEENKTVKEALEILKERLAQEEYTLSTGMSSEDLKKEIKDREQAKKLEKTENDLKQFSENLDETVNDLEKKIDEVCSGEEGSTNVTKSSGEKKKGFLDRFKK